MLLLIFGRHDGAAQRCNNMASPYKKPYKFRLNISPNISNVKNCTDLKLHREPLYIKRLSFPRF